MLYVTKFLSDSKANTFGLRMMQTIIKWTDNLRIDFNMPENVALHKAF
jgi:hypothetical protein